MAAIVCSVPSSVDQAFQKAHAHGGPGTKAIILKCVKSSQTVEIDQELNNVTAEDIQYSLDGNRFLLYRCGFTVPQDPHGKVAPATIFIWFNPMDVPVDVKRMYKATEEQLTKRWKIPSFHISVQEDFDEKWLNSKGYYSFLTGSKGAIPGIQHGTFESNPLPTEAATGSTWGGKPTEHGTFENKPEASKADTGATWGASAVEHGTFENVPEPSKADTRSVDVVPSPLKFGNKTG